MAAAFPPAPAGPSGCTSRSARGTVRASHPPFFLNQHPTIRTGAEMPNDHRSHNQIAPRRGMAPRRAMDLGVLKCFSRIAALGSMSRAASDLGISQPALTRQIKRLEHDLGN